MGAFATKLRNLFSNKKLELCLVGLENAGKTTLVNVLALGQAIDTLPTVGLDVKVFKKSGVKMKVWDLGGQERFRYQWPQYTADCNVIVYVVDAHAPERLDLARRELHRLLDDQNLSGIPILIALNKVDLHPHISKEDAIRELNLTYVTDNKWLVVEIRSVRRSSPACVIRTTIPAPSISLSLSLFPSVSPFLPPRFPIPIHHPHPHHRTITVTLSTDLLLQPSVLIAHPLTPPTPALSET